MKKNELIAAMGKKIHSQISKQLAPKGQQLWQIEQQAVDYAERMIAQYRAEIVYRLIGIKQGSWGMELSPEAERTLKGMLSKEKIQALYNKFFDNGTPEFTQKDKIAAVATYKKLLRNALEEKLGELAREEADRIVAKMKEELTGEHNEAVAQS